MRAKKLSCIALALLMLAAFAACTGNTAEPTGTPVPSATSAPNETAAPSEEPTHIAVFGFDVGTATERPEVVEAINKISLEQINVTFEFETAGIAAYGEQLNLKFAAKEKNDLFMTGTIFNYANQVAQGYLHPLTELAKTYASESVELLGPNFYNASVNGEIYAILNIRDMSSFNAFYVRRDLKEKYGWDYSSLTSPSKIKAFLAAAKKDLPGTMTLTNCKGTSQPIAQVYFGNAEYGAMYKDSDSMILYPTPYDNNNVMMSLENDNYLKACAAVRELYVAGYTPKDLLPTSVQGLDMAKAGTLATYIASANAQNQSFGQTGYWYDIIRMSEPRAMAGTHLTWGISYYTDCAEAAMKFFNLTMTNADVVNLFDFGIENKHYVKTADGHVTFPEGVDANKTGYYNTMRFMFGNEYISYVWEGEDLDVWEKLKKDDETAKRPKNIGFSFDSNPVKSEYAAVTNVFSQYVYNFENGMVDPYQVKDEAAKALKNAGFDKVLAEYQKQIDAWYAANNKQ